MVTALERKYGHQHQAGAFRGRFQAKARMYGEPLQKLAQELEHLVRRAYPGVPEVLTSVLLRDQFVDALGDHQFQIFVKQAHANDLQKALARELEFESFVMSSGTMRSAGTRRQELWARKSNVRERLAGAGSGKFAGTCWECQQRGHRRSDVLRAFRAWSQERGRPNCWECGQLGQYSRASPQTGPVYTPPATGNVCRLEDRAQTQPAFPKPHSC